MSIDSYFSQEFAVWFDCVEGWEVPNRQLHTNELAAIAITKSMFADAENITNSSWEKIQLNAVYAQTKKNFPVKKICFCISLQCSPFSFFHILEFPHHFLVPFVQVAVASALVGRICPPWFPDPHPHEFFSFLSQQHKLAILSVKENTNNHEQKFKKMSLVRF